MATTQRTPRYKRKVSFDSLSPHVETEPDEPLHIPPQYLPTEAGTSSSATERNLGYGFDTGTKATDINKVFHSFQEVNRPASFSGHSYKSRKVPKLPPAQGKSILKSYVLSPQGDCDITAYIPRTPLVPATSLNPKPKKKSIVDMTPEELMQMDQQFRKAVDPETLKFDGDEYLPAAGKYAGLTTLETRRASQVKNIEKFVGTKKNNRNVLTPSLMNYNSFVANYRHEDMSHYITQHYGRAVCSPEERSRLIDGSPLSLRDILVYISGRHHTWAALDWAVNNVLEDGDSMVLICQVPELVAVDPLNMKDDHDDGLFDIEDDENDKNNDDNDDNDDNDKNKNYDGELPDYEYVGVDQHYGWQGIQHQADRLLKYLFKKLDECGKTGLKVSFTVELIKETKVSTLLKKAVALHSPHVMITSSLVTHQMYSQVKPMRLPFYISSKLSVPTVIVPYRLIEPKCLNKESSVAPHGISINVEDHDDLADGGGSKGTSLIDMLDAFTNSVSPLDGEETSGSFPSSRSDSHSRSASSAGTPTDYLGPNSRLIKFADTGFHPGGSGSFQGSHSLGSRRNSSTSTGMYKVKSLLDSEPMPSVSRSKSQTTPLSSALSNGSHNHLEKTSTRNTLRKSKSEPQEEKKGFLGLFRKKKK